jgi:hypothetical protein
VCGRRDQLQEQLRTRGSRESRSSASPIHRVRRRTTRARKTSSSCSRRFPQGPTGAKARFYFWATALARRQSGENQFYTALALHELYDANQDPLIRDQALKAYRSVLTNFFGSVTVFTCCPGLSPDGEPVPFPVGLNELTADALYRTDATGYERLVPGDPLLVLSLLLEWGFDYLPANPPTFEDGVVSVINF